MLEEDILLQVKKPGRYLGNEWNAVKKDFQSQDVKFALCFPDLYEIGMSNLGLRIVYGLLNSREGIVCERVFLPDTDMQKILRERKIPLFSLESRMALAEFDFIGFCLSYELNYTNILAILDLAAIPLLASERDLSFPLVIGGGACVSNPEPLSDFIDLFLIGEAEEALLEIIERYKEYQAAGRHQVTKEGLLKELAKIDGVYVPSFYEVEYNQGGAVKKFSPKYSDIPLKIKKRIVNDLNQAYYPTSWLVPYVQIIHDRAPVELMRGCPHRCNFCQARNLYHNLRLRSPSRVMELARSIAQSSGYEEISFLGLSISDYPYLSEVISSLSEKFQGDAVAISLPSLRPKAYLGELATFLARVRKTTFTFAPEAGSEKMRKSINKNFQMEEFYSAVLSAYLAGWQAVKLYFMIGLPGEDYDDLDGILEIAREVSGLRKKAGRMNRGEVRLSISFFVPKPHTAFEREAMDSTEALQAKILYLRNKSRALPRAVKLKFHTLENSLLEAVFSRGDRALGKVLLAAYRKGCLLDGWSEHFRFGLWLEAFGECLKSIDFYLKRREESGILPWEHIDLVSDNLTA